MEFAKEVIIDISRLQELNIEYMIVGGQAITVHGNPRFTWDIDVSIGLAPHEFEAVTPILSSGEYEPTVEEVPDFLRQMYVLPVRHVQTNIHLDMIFAISEYETAAIKRAATVELDGSPVRFIAAEDLIIHKLIAGRAVDEADVRSVIVRNRDTLDYEYLQHWMERFDESIDLDLIVQFKSLRRRIEKGEA